MYKDIDKQIKVLKNELGDVTKLKLEVTNLSKEYRDRKEKQKIYEDILKRDKNDIDELSNFGLERLIHIVKGDKDKLINSDKREIKSVEKLYEENIDRIVKIEMELKPKREELINKCKFLKEYNSLIDEKEVFIMNDKEINDKLLKLREDKKEYIININRIKDVIKLSKTILKDMNNYRYMIYNSNQWVSWEILGTSSINDLMRYSTIEEYKNLATETELNIKDLKEKIEVLEEVESINLNCHVLDSYGNAWVDAIFLDLDLWNAYEKSIGHTDELEKETKKLIDKLYEVLSKEIYNLEKIELERAKIIEEA